MTGRTLKLLRRPSGQPPRMEGGGGRVQSGETLPKQSHGVRQAVGRGGTGHRCPARGHTHTRTPHHTSPHLHPHFTTGEPEATPAWRAGETHPVAWHSAHPLGGWTRGSSARRRGTAPPGERCRKSRHGREGGGRVGMRGTERGGGSRRHQRRSRTPSVQWVQRGRTGSQGSRQAITCLAEDHLEHAHRPGSVVAVVAPAEQDAWLNTEAKRSTSTTTLEVDRELCTATLVRDRNGSEDQHTVEILNATEVCFVVFLLCSYMCAVLQ